MGDPASLLLRHVHSDSPATHFESQFLREPDEVVVRLAGFATTARRHVLDFFEQCNDFVSSAFGEHRLLWAAPIECRERHAYPIPVMAIEKLAHYVGGDFWRNLVINTRLCRRRFTGVLGCILNAGHAPRPIDQARRRSPRTRSGSRRAAPPCSAGKARSRASRGACGNRPPDCATRP